MGASGYRAGGIRGLRVRISPDDIISFHEDPAMLDNTTVGVVGTHTIGMSLLSDSTAISVIKGENTFVNAIDIEIGVTV